MSCPVGQESLEKLKQFIDNVKLQPDILHLPQLAFFKDFIESFGGSIPKMSTEAKSEELPEEPTVEEIVNLGKFLELDYSGCVDETDPVDVNQRMGDPDKEISEEDCDKADLKRSEAMSEFSNGNFDKAIELYTEAIELNPLSAVLFAKRGQAFLKANRLHACLKDCCRALELNPNSAAAYKFRGRAYRLLGEFEKAAQDLRQACNIDFDEETDAWLKEVTPNAKKIEDYRLKEARRCKEKEEKIKLEEIRKAKEARAQAGNQPEAEQADSEPGVDAGGLPPGMADLFQDPEILTAMQDPEVAAAFKDITANPASILKYSTNPKILALLSKLNSKIAGSGVKLPEFFGAPGGPDFGPPGSGAAPTGGDYGLD